MKYLKPWSYTGCNSPAGCDYYNARRSFNEFARFDVPFCLSSIIPVTYLMYLYRKDEEAWRRDKVLLLPTFVVLGFTAALGLYTEIHLSLIDWLDIDMSQTACNLTFNSLLALGMTPYIFLPIIPLLQLIDCFYQLNPLIKQGIAYSWAAIVFGVRFVQMIFGEVRSSVMCYGARTFLPLFYAEYSFTYLCRDVSACVGILVIVLGLISAVLTRLNIPFRYISVDFHSIKRTFALSLPTVLLIIAHKAISKQYYYEQDMAEFNLRVLFSSCHFGSIALLLILLNHYQTLWTFISESLLCQKKTKVDLSDAKIIL